MRVSNHYVDNFWKLTGGPPSFLQLFIMEKKKKKQYGDGLSQHKVSHATYPISLYVDIICINIFIYLFNSCMNVSPTFPGSLVLFHNFYYIYTRENEQSKNLHNFQKVGTNMHLSIWLQSSILATFLGVLSSSSGGPHRSPQPETRYDGLKGFYLHETNHTNPNPIFLFD